MMCNVMCASVSLYVSMQQLSHHFEENAFYCTEKYDGAQEIEEDSCAGTFGHITSDVMPLICKRGK